MVQHGDANLKKAPAGTVLQQRNVQHGEHFF